MKKRNVLALMMAMAMSFTVAAPSITANAEGLTQASSPDQVQYGQVTAEEKELLKTVFDVEYYLLMNPDLANTVGNDFDKLFEHFCTLGIYERRACNPNFDVSAYASAYPDLKDNFGLDIMKYYEHYATIGKAENRSLTTLEACANAGITVTVISDYPYQITPNAYKVAKLLGTTDFKTVSTAIESAASGNDVVVSSGSGRVVLSWKAASEKLSGLTKVGEYTVKNATRSVGHYVSETIYIYVDSNNEYAARTNGDYSGTGIDYITGGQADPASNIILFKTSDSFDITNSKEVGSVYFRAGDPISPRAIINGSMPVGGIDVISYTNTHSNDGTQISENVESTGSYYTAQYNDGIGSNFNDAKGSVDSNYDISINITKTDDGANVTLAVSNQDDEFAVINETNISNVTAPEAGQNND